jgi:hypothetical protein
MLSSASVNGGIPLRPVLPVEFLEGTQPNPQKVFCIVCASFSPPRWARWKRGHVNGTRAQLPLTHFFFHTVLVERYNAGSAGYVSMVNILGH